MHYHAKNMVNSTDNLSRNENDNDVSSIKCSIVTTKLYRRFPHPDENTDHLARFESATRKPNEST